MLNEHGVDSSIDGTVEKEHDTVSSVFHEWLGRSVDEGKRQNERRIRVDTREGRV